MANDNVLPMSPADKMTSAPLDLAAVPVSDDLLDLIPSRVGSKYSRQDVLTAATVFASTGRASQAAERAGVPVSTLADWRATDWWHPLTVAVRNSKQAELDGALTALIHSSIAAAQDRIASGDCRLVRRKDKNGVENHELVRVPVSARDAAIVAAVAADKRQIVRGEATEIVRHDSDRLSVLRDQMRTISGRVIEGESTPGT